MPYSRPFFKMRIQGVFGATAALGTEKWSTGVNISSLGGGSMDPANILTFLTNVSGFVTTFHTGTSIKAGSSCFLTQLTGAYIGTDGKYVLGSLMPTVVYNYVTPPVGNTTPIHPQATACVISLRSLRLRGPASHGRMYYPCTGLPVNGNDLTISPTNTSLIATAAKTLIDGINATAASSFGTGGKVSLVSRVGAGAEAIVTSVMVDQKFDHMESRERSIASSYSSAAPAVAAAAIAERDEDLRRRLEEFNEQFEDN
jgi:hypothetical protein